MFILYKIVILTVRNTVFNGLRIGVERASKRSYVIAVHIRSRLINYCNCKNTSVPVFHLVRNDAETHCIFRTFQLVHGIVCFYRNR